MEETITKERAARLMLPLHRPPDAYKNMCGVVGAVAGSAGMAGAAVLCVDGCMSGVGTNSCGPELAQEYRTPEDVRLACRFSF